MRTRLRLELFLSPLGDILTFDATRLVPKVNNYDIVASQTWALEVADYGFD
jgi:hypothetical protein